MGINETYRQDSDEKDDDDESEKKWVPPPLVPPRPPMFEKLVVGKSETVDDNEEDEDEDKPEAAVTDAEPAAQETEAEEAPADAVAAEAAPGEVLPDDSAEEEPPADEGVLHIRPQEPVAEALAFDPDDEEDQNPAAASAGSGSSGGSSTPPPPSPPVPPASAQPTPPSPQHRATVLSAVQGWGVGPNTRALYNQPPLNPNIVPVANALQPNRLLQRTEEDARREGLRRGLVAGFLTGYILKSFLASRKRERYEKAAQTQIKHREEQIATMQHEQQSLKEQLAARAEEYRKRQQAKPTVPGGAEKVPAVATKEAPPQKREVQPHEQLEQIFDMEGNEIILKQGWRIKREAGSYSVVLDEHNRVVHDAIQYGEAFKRDQKREQLSDDLFAALGGGAPANVAQSAPVPTTPALGRQAVSQGGPAPVPSQPQPVADNSHDLSEPHNPVKAAIMSPWLWTATAFLLIIYFLATLV